MRSKIQCDGVSYNVFEFLIQLNKGLLEEALLKAACLAGYTNTRTRIGVGDRSTVFEVNSV